MRFERRQVAGFAVDWQTVVLVGLLVAFQAAVVASLQLALDGLATSAGSGASGGAGAGGSAAQESSTRIVVEILAIAAVQITALVAGWRLYTRLPDRYQRWIRLAVNAVFFGALYLLGLVVWYAVGLAWLYIILAPILIAAFRYVSSGGLKWIPFNVLAFVLGVTITIVVAINLSPALVVALMAAFLVYDHFAVQKSNVMGDLVALSASGGIPNFFVIPSRTRIDFAELQDALLGKAEKPDSVATIIGVGDFVFPTALLGSVVVARGLDVVAVGVGVGTALAMIMLRDALIHSDEPLPALPWLNTGAIGGYATVIAVVAVV